MIFGENFIKKIYYFVTKTREQVPDISTNAMDPDIPPSKNGSLTSSTKYTVWVYPIYIYGNYLCG